MMDGGGTQDQTAAPPSPAEEAAPRGARAERTEGTDERTAWLTGGGGPLVGWLLQQRLLRGPFLFTDYWASVFRLDGVEREERAERGQVDRALFRVGLDRPDLELPRFRYYLLLFFLGPILLPFRAFRRMGRFPIRFRRESGRAVLDRLQPFRLELETLEPGRVRVRKGGETIAEDVLDPRLMAGFSSLFFASYKIPLASLSAILSMAILAPLGGALGWLPVVMEYWIPVGFPLLVLLIWVVFRDWTTAILGALPVLFARYLLALFTPHTVDNWWPFLGALAALFLLYLLADWLFMPRPVPPVLYLYVADGPGRTYARSEDAPWWLEGRAYWVWRYMMLTPAELNKFWEKDWERSELWIRADGPRAGLLEWVVTDAHYRELWMPARRLGEEARYEEHGAQAMRDVEERRPGVWLVEVDAHVIFHTPWVRTVSYLSEGEDVPVRSVRHLLSGLFRGESRDEPKPYLAALDALKIRRGSGVLDDLPEAVVPRAARHVLSLPWRYWRYPLGVHCRREAFLYGDRPIDDRPAAADRALQIKEGTVDLP